MRSSVSHLRAIPSSPASASPSFEPFRAPDDLHAIETVVRYAGLIARRGYICNALGNIALRRPNTYDPTHGVIFTKHRNVSLEEMDTSNVVVTDVTTGKLLSGAITPAEGHVMNRACLLHRPDMHAVVHVHNDETPGLFTVTGWTKMRYVSRDLPLLLGRDVVILPPELNIERDTTTIPSFIQTTDVIVMPTHGVTCLGRTVSEAYHKLNTFVAEVRRIFIAMEVAAHTKTEIKFLSDADVEELHEECRIRRARG